MFLDTVEPFPQDQLAQRIRNSSHWLKLAEELYKLESPTYVLKLMKLELDTKCRPYHIKRLYSRFSALRRQQEQNDLKELLSGAFYPDVDESITRMTLTNMASVNNMTGLSDTQEKVLSLLKFEYDHCKRPYMIKRLYGKFSMMRYNQEQVELEEVLKANGV
ncbi:MAG: hypothetical protein PHX79_03665 [Sphaerochaetaceae bacterium]|nr:hypothetical protein [Sphaerochaetaceae bacterium]